MIEASADVPTSRLVPLRGVEGHHHAQVEKSKVVCIIGPSGLRQTTAPAPAHGWRAMIPATSLVERLRRGRAPPFAVDRAIMGANQARVPSASICFAPHERLENVVRMGDLREARAARPKALARGRCAC